MTSKTILILGASGKFGRNAAEAFWNAGWRVRSFNRATDDLDTALRGVAAAIVAVNPPTYDLWEKELLPLHRKIIAAAERAGVPLLVPGNVYVFGPETPTPWGPDSAHRATNPLGKLRIEMERLYAQASCQTILLRAGDYIDTEASGGWFDRIIAKSIARGRLAYPGALDVPHAWAFLPDMARAAVALVEARDSLPQHADIPFAGYTVTADQMAQAASVALARPVRAQRMSWLPLWLLRPFWPVVPGLMEMRYLWDVPHGLDGTAFARIIPDFRATPLVEAMRAACTPLVKPKAANPQGKAISTQTSA